MDKNVDKYLPPILLTIAVALVILRPGAESLAFVGIAASMWAFQYLFPQDRLDRFVKLDEELALIEKRCDILQSQIAGFAGAGAQFREEMQKELASLKTVIQMKQLGR